MGCALPAFMGLLALLASARPAAGEDSAGVPASVLAHQHVSSEQQFDDFSALALGDLNALTEPWLPASSAPAPARGSYGISNTTSLQAVDPEAGVVKRLRGVGIFGPNIPNELQVFFQNGLKWYYTWRCAHLPARKHSYPSRAALYNILDLSLVYCYICLLCCASSDAPLKILICFASAVLTPTPHLSKWPACTTRSLCL